MKDVTAQAAAEIDDMLNEQFDRGLNPMASIALGDVRRIMLVCWIRGYSAREEDFISGAQTL